MKSVHFSFQMSSVLTECPFSIPGHVTFSPGAPRDPWAVTLPQTPPDVLGVCITLGSCPHLALPRSPGRDGHGRQPGGRAALLPCPVQAPPSWVTLMAWQRGVVRRRPLRVTLGADVRCHLLPHPLSYLPLVSGVLICRWLHLSVSTAQGRLGGSRTRPLCFLPSGVFILGSSRATSPAGHFPALAPPGSPQPWRQDGWWRGPPSGCRPGAWLLNTAGCPVVSFLVPEPHWMLMPQPSAATRTSS